MVGYCGTGKSHKRYYYYRCKGQRQHICDMPAMKKDTVESIVLDKCRELLQDDVIDRIVTAMVDHGKKEYATSELAWVEKQLSDVNRKLQIATKAIIDCDSDIVRKQLYLELPPLEERKILESKVAEFKHQKIYMDPATIKRFLLSLRDGSYESDNSKIGLINTFINKVVLYEDRLSVIYNTGQSDEVVSERMLRYIEEKSTSSECSSNSNPVDSKGIEPSASALRTQRSPN